jgi:hypothetical protein
MSHTLTYQLDRVASGEITARWFDDCRRVVERFAELVTRGRLVEDLSASDFERVRARLIRQGTGSRRAGLGVHALNRAVTVIRGVLKYAYRLLTSSSGRATKKGGRCGAKDHRCTTAF